MDDRTCAGCGAPLRYLDGRSRQAKWCSERCKWRTNERRRTRAHRVHRHCCRGCGATFESSGSGTRYCSSECRRAALVGRRPGKQAPTSCPIPWGECDWCGRWFVKRYGRKYCSRFCINANHPSRHRVTEIIYGDCSHCGRCFVRRQGQAKVFCSDRCAKRTRNNFRKHLKRASAGGEVFTLREIAERDGWRCHICHRKVPDREYRARKLDPTLDHLVPVSAGGTHTRDNVALAHNRCNWERNVGGEVQLRLVG